MREYEVENQEKKQLKEKSNYLSKSDIPHMLSTASSIFR